MSHSCGCSCSTILTCKIVQVTGYVCYFQMDLDTLLDKKLCECLNEADDHPYEHALTSGGGFLESDCDEQLILSLSFNQAVKVHSLKLKAPADKGPKNIRIFMNQPNTIDFDKADSMVATQDLM